MISKAVINSDAFSLLPLSAQALYIHFSINSDDDGFVSSPHRTLRSLSCSETDLGILLESGFLISFETGAIVIAHWHVHNSIRKDRYTKTYFTEELKMLRIRDNKAYCLIDPDVVGCPDDNQCATQSSLGEVSADEVSSNQHSAEEQNSLPTVPLSTDSVSSNFELFWNAYPHKVHKSDAMVEFNNLNPDSELFSIIMNALNLWCNNSQWLNDDGKFIPHPSNWLKKRKWESVPKEVIYHGSGSTNDVLNASRPQYGTIL